MFLRRLAKVRAPEFPRGLTWLSGKPLTLKALRGKAVLVDFWTYSCVNCLRTLPHLKEWHERYGEKGLQIIGVHTPEFAFEREEKNVKKAIADFGLLYPVVLDNDYKVWNLYANRWWPRHFLIDAHGYIVYDHVGEGGYAETEQAIQKVLVEAGASGLPPVRPDLSLGGGICYRTTPELYLGFLRGRFGNGKSFAPNAEQVFTDEGEHEEDIIYLHGHWSIEAEAARHDRALPFASEYIALKYSAFSVNLVMGTSDNRAARVELELDGRPLPADMAGSDVVMEDGRATVQVKGARMYNLVNADIYHKGVLKVKTGAGNLVCYAFTFGGCKGL